MKNLLKYLKGFEKECILGPFFKLLEACFELMIPLVVAKIVDIGIRGDNQSLIYRQCGLMILLGVVGLLCAVTAQWFAAKAAVGFSTRLRHGCLSHILTLSPGQMESISASTLITRLTSDVNQVQNGLNLTIRLLLRSPFVVFGAMIMAFRIDRKAALIFLAVIPVLSLVVFGIMLITMPMYRKIQASLDKVTSAVRENLAGTRVLRAFCMEKRETDAFREKTRQLKENQISAGRISALLNPVTFVIINLALVILIRTGAVQVEAGILTQGLVIALYNYMSQILVELIKLANLIINMTKSAACAGRLSQLLMIQPGQTSGSCREPIQGWVEMKDVTARYPGAGAPSLQNISFTASPGETVGIIGGTGSGKSTLINLILRLYDPESGSVLIDGRKADSYDLTFLRSRIGLVPQNPQLFKGTIRSNLLWGRIDASDEDLMEALKTAQALDLLENHPEGLSREVSQDGLNLSGGQRQRLTIGRALVRKPRILILDDSASALDFGTEARLRKAFRERSDPPTTFIVSQRAASVMHADQILVLEDGRLAGCGNHESLIKTCNVYREIYASQFPGEVKADD